MLRSVVNSFRLGSSFDRNTAKTILSANSSIRFQPAALQTLSPQLSNSRYHFSTNNKDMSKEEYQKLKEEGKNFYTQNVSNIIQLKSTGQWVSTMSFMMDLPVIVDFYADWCESCKILTPKLEEKVKKSEKVKLLKVNIDNCQELAHRLRGKQVPTVYLIHQGKLIDRFQGVPTDAQLDKFFEKCDKITEIFYKREKQTKKLDQVKQLVLKGDIKAAEELLVSLKSVEEDVKAIRDIFLARVYFILEEIPKFKNQVQIIKKYEQFYSHNPDLKKLYDTTVQQANEVTQNAHQNSQIVDLKQKVSKNPEDLASVFKLAEKYKELEMVEQSLEQAINIIKSDKNWEDKKANKLVLETFKELGNASPITQKYRKLFQRALN